MKRKAFGGIDRIRRRQCEWFVEAVVAAQSQIGLRPLWIVGPIVEHGQLIVRLAQPTVMGGLRDVVHTPCEIGQGGLGLVESIGELRIDNAYHPSYEKVFVLGENPRVL